MVNPRSETASGLYLSENHLDDPRWGWVLDVGEGISDLNGNLVPPDFELGDLVYFNRHAPEKCDYTAEGCGVLHLVSSGDVVLKVKDAGNSNIIPMGNFVEIEEIEEEKNKVSPGGIILPDQVVERPTKGRVLSVGPGQRTLGKLVPPRVKPGDIVRYRKHTTMTINFVDVDKTKPKTTLITYGDIVLIETDEFLDTIKARKLTLPVKD